jgi:hypothetical protein
MRSKEYINLTLFSDNALAKCLNSLSFIPETSTFSEVSVYIEHSESKNERLI